MRRTTGRITLGLAVVAAAALLWGRGAVPPRDASSLDRAPRLAPDYTDITLPPNIAPLNFRIAEPGHRFYARWTGRDGRTLAVGGRRSVMCMALRPWRRLLAGSSGGDLTLDVYVQDAAGHWTRFAPVIDHVAAEPIDDHLVYRFFRPVYTTTTPLGIYQRDLTSFETHPILRREKIGGQCLNCHAFADRRPDRFSLQTRNATGGGAMVLVQGGQATKIDTRSLPSQKPAALTTWHPGGKWIISSRNWIRQYFHEAGSPGRDALDARSGLTLIDVASHKTVDPPEINPPGYLPTFPCWSPDGLWLYFSRVKRTWPENSTMPVAEQPTVLYDLVRAAFDPDSGTWGATETVLAAADVGYSILQPRVSPDGHWLVVTLAEYGGFPIFRAQADLAMIDLTQRPWRAVSLDSAVTTRRDTWHSWSSNSRWLVCSRKADNGLFARPYLRYIGPDGRCGKAFALPQADPTWYDRSLYTFNVPELVNGAVTISEDALAAAAGRERQASTEAGQSP